MKKFLSIFVVLLLISSCSMTQDVSQSYIPDTWQTFTHQKYHYQLSYPSGWTVEGNDYGGSMESETMVFKPFPMSLVIVKRYGAYQDNPNSTPKNEEILTSDLSEFAQHVWQINSDNKKLYGGQKAVTPLTELSINGIPAYSFTATKAFMNPPFDEGGGWALNQETTFLMFHQNLQNFIVFYQTDDEALQRVAQTFTFLSQ